MHGSIIRALCMLPGLPFFTGVCWRWMFLRNTSIFSKLSIATLQKDVVYEKTRCFESSIGIPQGCPLSTISCNKRFITQLQRVVTSTKI